MLAEPVVHDTKAAPVTVFLCANCARAPQAPTATGRSKPAIPDFGWPVPVRQILVPCTGRLQPEHVLKAIEAGSDLVCAIACEEDNCHYLEGSKRCARRVSHLRTLLQEVGIGGERLMLFHLPGTAVEDMALAEGRPAPEGAGRSSDGLAASIRDEVMRTLRGLPRSPLGRVPQAAAGMDSRGVLVIRDDNSEE